MSLPKLTRIRRLAGLKVNPVSAAALTLSGLRNGGAVINRTTIAGAQAFTLPASTGKRGAYRFVVGVTATGNKTWKTAGSDVFAGLADIGATASDSFPTASNTNTITLNGTTLGGIIGTQVEFTDAAVGVWAVKVFGVGSGTAATPFSNT